MITSDHATTLVGEIDAELTPVESVPIGDGRMPLCVERNRLTGQTRPVRVPVEGQEFLR